MPSCTQGLNPKILRWARERQGLTPQDVARVIKKDVDTVVRWESGESAPTYVQLEKLAYQLYKRPVALFFFPEPPEEADPAKSFRTLPQTELEALPTRVRSALRQAQAMQVGLGELTDGTNPASKRILSDLAVGGLGDAEVVAKQVRDYLGVQVSSQSSWRGPRDALNHWRESLQFVGIFTFRQPMKGTGVWGFCLPHEEFPVIYLNSSAAHTRQVFSLFHELGHLFLDTGGITKDDDSFVTRLPASQRRVEVFCNAFAAEVLVPSQDFEAFRNGDFREDAFVDSVARRYKVSREAILRRALDRGLVSQRHYRAKAQEWATQAEETIGSHKGGDYYANMVSYLGEGFVKLAFSRYYQGACTDEQLADYLNVKVRNLPGIEPFAVSGGTRS